VRAEVIDQRIESYAAEKPGTFDIVSARALAPVPDLCTLAAPFLDRRRSVLILLKGQGFARELKEASKSWDFDVVTTPSVTDSEGRILALRNLAHKGSS
jgi:16S rRNA (guanine527-N7)-methyltransferase